MNSYRLITYRGKSGPRSGVVLGAEFHDVADLTGEPAYATVEGILDSWESAQLQLSGISAMQPKHGQPLAAVKLLSPVLRPGTIYCAGANYADHVENMARKFGVKPDPDPHELGLSPWHFIKSSWCVVEDHGEVKLEASFLDWEAELGVVIGRRARNVGIAQVFDYVAGYTIGNDLSARDRTLREGIDATSPFRYDWIGQKNFDGACPLGPWIAPCCDVSDPQALGISTFVNEQLKQNSNTSKMIFTIAEQVSFLSSRITLHPGDVILTGTPAGVGAETGECLKKGDRVRVEIEGIGELVTNIV